MCVCMCACVCVSVVWIGSVQPGMFSNRSYQSDQGSYTGLSSVEMYEKKKTLLCPGLDGYERRHL